MEVALTVSAAFEIFRREVINNEAYPNRIVLEVRYLIFFQYGMHSIRERLVKILVGYLNEMQYSMIG